MDLNNNFEVVVRWEDIVITNITVTCIFSDPVCYDPYCPEILEKDNIIKYRKKLVKKYGFK